nr:11727_t:CDS:2 [Entrophospora candida]
MDPEILLYRLQLDDNEFHLLSNPPCKLYSRITEFISANPNNVDYISITKSPNSFFFYRKNYIGKHKSSRSKKDGKILSKEAGDAWNNESDKVKSYFKALAKVAHKQSELQLQQNDPYITQLQQKQEENFYNDCVASLSSFYPYSTFFCTTSYNSEG